MRRVLVAAALVGLALVPFGATAAVATTTESSPSARATAAADCSGDVQRNVQYRTPPGSPPAQTTLDVYPAPDACTGEAGPIVVWVHGGGWSIGDKAQVGAKPDLVHDLGAALVSVNYRLAPRRAGRPGVQHPAQADDVAAAVAWAAAHAPSFGADPQRVVLIGHSAGGHLVSLVGTDPRYLRDAGVADDALRCVVALDTEGYDLAETVAKGGLAEGLVRNAFGDDPSVWRDASPITHAADRERGEVSYLVVTRGTRRRQAEAARFVDAVQDAGADARLLRVPGFSHADVGRLLGTEADPTLTPAVRDFLSSCASPRDGDPVRTVSGRH